MGGERTNARREPELLPDPMHFYNQVVIEHFTNPRNVGELPEAETDGFGMVGDPSCGDQMKLWIAVRDRTHHQNGLQVLWLCTGQRS